MPERDIERPGLGDTPIMPTGSGVADLEIAREIDALDADEPLIEKPDAITDDEIAPTLDSPAAAESESHPS